MLGVREEAIKMMHKTNKKQFEIFKKSFIYYQNLFELNNYHTLFFHERVRGAYAKTGIDNDHHVVRVSFSTDWLDRDPIDYELKHCALHESLHLLISKLMWLGTCRYVTITEIDQADEELTVKMTNILTKAKI